VKNKMAKRERRDEKIRAWGEVKGEGKRGMK